MIDLEPTGWSLGTDRLKVVERAGPVAILRLHRPSPGVFDRLGAAFAVDWPSGTGTSAGGWIGAVGPTEWVLVGAAADGAVSRAAAACGDALHHVAQVGEGRRTWRISGPGAPGLLARGCTLDVHQRALPAGSCARTLFAQVHALIARDRSADAGFYLMGDVSLTHHLRAWFGDTARDL